MWWRFFKSIINNYRKDSNSLVDNRLLLEVYSGNVNILVTDDKQILQKANELYIGDFVLSSSDLLSKFEDKYPKNIDYKMLSIKLKKFSDVNINDDFFDSLKTDYIEFDEWFRKKGDEEAYVIQDKDNVKGFLYLKQEFENENYYNIEPF